MKAKKNPLGANAQFRAMKERERRIATAILLAIILLAVALSVYFTYEILSSSPENRPLEQDAIKPSLQFKPENPNSQFSAAIVDQVSLTFPNQTFIVTVASTLTRIGYMVDYFSSEKVTVDFYRSLPTYGYGLVILRVHSAAAVLEGEEFVEAPVSLFTSENYSQTKYVQEQLTGQLLIGSYSMPEPPYYFGITPKFVTTSMNGGFQNTQILMMGCEGLDNTKMAEAFIERGAKTYISWKGSVSESYADQVTIQLLQHLVTENQTVKRSVENTLENIGPDPECNNTLGYYPQESGDYSIQR